MAAPRLDPDRLRRARAYRKFSLWTGLASTATGVLVLVALHVLEIGVFARYMTNPMELPFARPIDAAPIFLVISLFTVIGWVVRLPFSYLSWRRGRREGLVVQPLAGAFTDSLKTLVLTLILLGIPLTAWYAVLPRPDWWLWTIAGAGVLAIVSTLLGPALTWLFFRFEPLTDQAVTERVRAVAERAGVRVSGVYRWGLGAKTTAANAAVIGLGPTKRIALGDTLLASFPMDEVESVVAHEVGHDVSGDPPRYVVAFAVAGSAALILTRLLVDAVTSQGLVHGAADPASYPLVAAALSVIGLLGRPGLMAFTRWRESAADSFGARHTSRESMARALVRLADQNLVDPEPPRWEQIWFYSHPAIANRVRALGQPWPPSS
ncbi:MAG: M48 family metalloprotease [Chloroflexi bacterium]|nr:M48 family metalloprotease [Chloroflexota bacterium]